MLSPTESPNVSKDKIEDTWVSQDVPKTELRNTRSSLLRVLSEKSILPKAPKTA